MSAHGFLDPLELFPPSRAAALERLAAFVPCAGGQYASKRNADPGPGLKGNVSMLSPYVRHRLITEHEVVEAVLQRFAPSTAEKFIQEVLWRTYWKGWLQLRPQVWRDFLDERDRDRQRVQAHAGLARALEQALTGRTGIACFDDWVTELKATGYLHNHARMWFASIWIFTLKLPWALGADFFLRHLLDADPASNTLSWRWVAGIQTRGKTYLARPDNIEKYTDGRYSARELAGQLATEASPIRDEVLPERRPIRPPDSVAPDTRVLMLLHGEDLRGFETLPMDVDLAGVVVARAGDAESPWPYGEKARAFVAAAAEDAASGAGSMLGVAAGVLDELDPAGLVEAARAAQVECIVTTEAPVGPIDDGLDRLGEALKAEGLTLLRLRRAWDANAWPHASKGFFPFRKRIPELLERAGLA